MSEEGGMKRLYPVIIGVALVAALFFLWSGRDVPIKNMPKDKEAGNPYICTACGKTEELSPYDLANWIGTKGQEVERGGEAGGPRTSMRSFSLPCAQCGEMTLVLASKCLECGKIYRGGECPDCVPEASDEPEEEDKKPRRGRR